MGVVAPGENKNVSLSYLLATLCKLIMINFSSDSLFHTQRNRITVQRAASGMGCRM